MPQNLEMKLVVVSPSGRELDSIDVEASATVHDLKQEIQHSSKEGIMDVFDC